MQTIGELKLMLRKRYVELELKSLNEVKMDNDDGRYDKIINGKENMIIHAKMGYFDDELYNDFINNKEGRI